MNQLLHIVCVHQSLDEDLMFWDTLIRVLPSMPGRTFVVVGSGEGEARLTSQAEVSSEDTTWPLILNSAVARNVYERAMREKGKKFIQRLTDEGTPCVGFFGADRGLLKLRPEGSVTVSKAGSITALTRSGVVCVLLASGTDQAGNLIDLNPLEVCIEMHKALQESDDNNKGQIILLVNTADRLLVDKMVNGTIMSEENVDQIRGRIPSTNAVLPGITDLEIRVVTPSKLGPAPGAVWPLDR